jgi:hypothetical protein
MLCGRNGLGNMEAVIVVEVVAASNRCPLAYGQSLLLLLLLLRLLWLCETKCSTRRVLLPQQLMLPPCSFGNIVD